MKKIMILIMSVFFITTAVNAKEVCTIVSGTGHDIGDEIACGTEHFYILENDGTNIKALAKYNLYVGFNFYEDHEETIEEEKVLQNENAIGAHGGELGQPEFPEIGITRFYVLNDNFYNYGNPYGNETFLDAQLKPGSPDGGFALTKLNAYKTSLEEIGVDVENINLITISEINELTKQITGQYLPLEEWSRSLDNSAINYGGDTYVRVIGSLKDNLPDKYSWLWSTTYWTRTIVEIDRHESNRYIYFIDTLGDVCEAYECTRLVGAGLRPVVTLSNIDFDYKIKTKTDGNGTIKVEKENAKGGESIRFTLKPNEGYVLGEVKVTDATGKVLIFKDYTFTMPNADVLIEATFVKKNPETKDIAIIGISIITTIALFTVLINYKKLKKN